VEYDRDTRAALFAAVLVLLLFILSDASFRAEPEERAVPAQEVRQLSEWGTPVELYAEQLLPGERVTFGPFPMEEGVQCEAVFSWEGGGKGAFLCRPGESRGLKSGRAVTFTLTAQGQYTFFLENPGDEPLRELSGTFCSRKDPAYTPGRGSSPFSFSIPALMPGEEQEGSVYSLSQGEQLILTARVEGGVLTARLQGEGGESACHMEGRSVGILSAPAEGSYRLSFANEGTEGVWAEGLISVSSRK